MQVDDVNPLLNGSDHSVSTASSSTTKVTQCRGIMSPTRRRLKISKEKIGKISSKESPNEDASMSETSSGINSSLSKHDDMVDPMNLYAMSQLGEPDPTAISKHDLLSAMNFDRTGDILSVGDRGGRVICFHLQDDENGVRDYEYLTEF